VVVTVLVTVVMAVTPASATTSAPGAVTPSVGEVVAEVGADRLPDPVEVDPDGREGLAVVGIAGRVGALGRGVAPAARGVHVPIRDDVTSLVEVDAVLCEGGVRRASRVGEQAEQQVAGADLAVAELACDVDRLGDGDSRFGVESGVHG
jgi:hypothetical protein